MMNYQLRFYLYFVISNALIIAFSFLSLLLSYPAFSEEINNFYTEILIKRDGTIYVREDIEYDFAEELKHGIFREIPHRYRIGIKNYNLRLNVGSVTNFEGIPYKNEISHSGGRVNVKIGDPDSYVTGVLGYRVGYKVEGAISFLEDHDELYWNVTGNEWNIPIGSAGTKIYFDEDIPEGITAACYTGTYGSKASDCSFNISPKGIEFTALDSLWAGEGLTIVIGVPKGFFREPSAIDKATWFIKDNWFFTVPMLTLIIISFVWHTMGRDPEGRGVVPVRYEPPKEMTPAEAGILMDEQADILDITSTVIDLAVRGFIRIEEIEGKSFYFFSDRDYKLKRVKEPQGNELKSHEIKIFNALFDSGKNEVMVSDLKNNFYKSLTPIKNSLYSELIRSRYFPTNPENVRRIFKWIGIGIIALSLFLIQDLTIKLSIALSGLFVLMFSRFMPRKTNKGSLAKEELLGFREFIERAEADRIERLAENDPTLFDRVLPYALIFGLEDRWANAFRDLYKNPPSWYSSPRYGDAFTPRIFVSDLGRSLNVMNSTFSSTPSRSGGSGFGGGGSSGGGFGGGGGRSW